MGFLAKILSSIFTLAGIIGILVGLWDILVDNGFLSFLGVIGIFFAFVYHFFFSKSGKYLRKANNVLTVPSVKVAGIIINAEETGLYMNEMPVIKISIKYNINNQEYQNELSIISRFLVLQKIKAGASISIYVDKSNPNNIGVDKEWLTSVDDTTKIEQENNDKYIETECSNDDVIKTQATISNCKETGVFNDGLPEIEFELTYVIDKETFSKTIKMLVDYQHLNVYKDGNQIPIIVSKEDYTKFIFEKR